VSEPLYKCHHCRDVAMVVRERFRADGVSLGTFASPCLNCVAGDEQRAEWAKNGLKRAAAENEIGIRRIDNLLGSENPEATAEQWRSAARDRQSRREEKSGPTQLGEGVDLGAARNPSSRRTSVQP
jgi:hypothetical protein